MLSAYWVKYDWLSRFILYTGGVNEKGPKSAQSQKDIIYNDAYIKGHSKYNDFLSST